MADCCCNQPHTHEGCPVLNRAVKAFGAGAVIGINVQYPHAPLYVGKKIRAEFQFAGVGKTWEEAFENVKKVKFQKANGQFVYEEEKK